MNKATRTEMSKRNFTVSIMGRIIGMITSFVGRTVFVKSIGAEYLGLGGFFGNIFGLLSLCELGFGAAIAQTLYKPLALGDKDGVSGIVAYYSKIIKRVACVSLFLSVAASAFLPRLIKSGLDLREILAAYYLFCLHSFVSYILIPKRTLVICDQRLYIVTAVRSVFGIAALCTECFVLVTFKSYLFYLAVRITFLAIEDLIVNRYADKKYPFLSVKRRIVPAYKTEIFSKVKALIYHKAGGILSRCTDSILVSLFAGLYGMGKYSNYALIIGTVAAFFDVAINAVASSIGNLGVTDRSDKSETVMRRLYFLNFCLLTTSCCVIVSTLNQIIGLWLGDQMLFSDFEMLVIVSSFYFSCIRDPVQVFVHSFGLFKQSRYIPILRAALNFVFSIMFINRIGIAGVFLGTVLSTVLAPLPGEVYVLYKYGFNKKCGKFLKEMLGYIGFSFLSAAVCFCVTYNMPQSFSGIVLRGGCSFSICLLIIYLVYSRSVYFEYFLLFIKNVFKKTAN